MKYKNLLLKMIGSAILWIPFFNWSIQTTLTYCSVKKSEKNSLVRNQKGFTVISVLVASALGIIVMVGVSQMFANRFSQLRQMEQRSQRIFFDEFIGSQLRTGCEETLKGLGSEIWQGRDKNFYQLKNENGRTILDLNAEKNQLKAKYGMTGHIEFQLKCSELLPNNCNCSSGTYPCQKKWTLNLLSQSLVNNMLVYNKNSSFELAIAYNSSLPSNFKCSILNTELAQLNDLADIKTELAKIERKLAVLNSATCSSRQALRGFTSAGSPICVALNATVIAVSPQTTNPPSTQPETCPFQRIKEYRRGKPVCCRGYVCCRGQDEYLKYVNSQNGLVPKCKWTSNSGMDSYRIPTCC